MQSRGATNGSDSVSFSILMMILWSTPDNLLIALVAKIIDLFASHFRPIAYDSASAGSLELSGKIGKLKKFCYSELNGPKNVPMRSRAGSSVYIYTYS